MSAQGSKGSCCSEPKQCGSNKQSCCVSPSSSSSGRNGCCGCGPNCTCCCCICVCPSAQVGQTAPTFSCQAVMANGQTEEISLDTYKEKYIVLFFYPFDFTFVCPSEIIAFDKAISEFQSRNVQVLGCSIDSAFVHTAWRGVDPKQGGIGKVNFPLLADVNHEISKKYGVLLPDGMALRGLFLIDKERMIQHMLVNNLSLGRSVEEAIRLVDALQFHEQHGEVCPANWKKGSKGMKPSAAGVAEYMSSHA